MASRRHPIADSPDRAPAPAEGSPTRWRVFPASLLIIFGGCLAILSAMQIALYLAGLNREPMPAGSPSRYIVGLIIMTIAGVLAVATGRLWWHRRWRWAIVGTLFAYGLGVLAASLAYPDPSGLSPDH